MKNFPSLSPLYVILIIKLIDCRNIYFLEMCKKKFVHFWRSYWHSTGLPPKQSTEGCAKQRQLQQQVSVEELSCLLLCEGLRVEQTTGKSEKHHPTQHLFLAVSRHYELHNTTVHIEKNIANLSSWTCWSQPANSSGLHLSAAPKMLRCSTSGDG